MKFFRQKLFPTLATALWLVFLFLDLTRMADTTFIKFAAICLCALTALTGVNTADGKLVAGALCLTVAADLFLLVRDDHLLFGLLLFLAVQSLYALRLYRLRPHPRRAPLLYLRAGLALVWAVLFVIEPTLRLLWTAALYFLNLCLNAIDACALTRKGVPLGKFAAGLLLFLCCDLCVGGWNIALFLPDAPAEFVRVGMWLFYLPSQVLIVLSQLESEVSP